MKARRVSRERVLQALYQFRISGDWQGMDLLREAFRPQEAEGEEEAIPEDRSFTSLLAEAVVERREEIDTLIEGVSRNWRLDRMAAVDLSVIRLATAELLLETAPPRVVLNEAVELARCFGTESSPAFVNGVLDGVLRELRRSGQG